MLKSGNMSAFFFLGGGCPKNVCEVIFKSDGRKNVEIIWYLEFSMRLLTAFSHLYSKNKAQKDKTKDVKKFCSLQIYKDRCAEGMVTEEMAKRSQKCCVGATEKLP